MASFWTVLKLDRVVADDCPLFVNNWFIGPIAVAVDFYPYYVTFVLWGLTLYQPELFTLLLSTTLSIDFLVNVALTYIFRIPPRNPDCGGPYEMPSFATQHIFVFTIIIILLIDLWDLHTSPWRLMMLQIFHTIVIAARVYIGINTITQLYAGALVGIIEAMIFQWIIQYIHTEKIWFLELWPVKKLGIQDTL